ncbi:MAG: hypothetical protein QNJ29_10400 [Rhizobiaceae bacterium]|nr:hypothetical protein [Rhizobiaceae bacterium]
MAKVLYEHKTQGKTLASLLFLVISIGAVVLGANLGAPIHWYIPVGFTLLFGAWWFMNNPNYGCKLTGETLEIWHNKDTRKFQLTDIAKAEVKEWMDGPDDIVLVMHDGSKHPISYLQYGNTGEFKQAIESVGLKIESVS